jgi:class 3 adenylate cyclase
MSGELREQALEARILVVDDVEANVLLLQNLLRQRGYRNISTATDSRTVVDLHRAEPFDLILLDLQMPHLDGFEVMEQLAPVGGADFLPVIVVTAFSDIDNRLKALKRGARDYILKPFVAEEALQRVGNYLEVRMLYRDRQRQGVLLEHRVAAQVAQLERLSRLTRFFSPHLAERIVAGGVDDPMRTHRREIAAVAIDLRGFTAFIENAEPEEVMAVVHAYHAEIGRLIVKHEGTIEYFAGDGIMVLFNDPVEVADPAERAVVMALEMHSAFQPLARDWARHGFELGMGIGISQGYATIGAIGFEGRWDYGAIGTVTNLAARLCAEARPGQTLVDTKVHRYTEEKVQSRAVGPFALKGFARAVPAFEVRRLRSTADPPLHEVGS